jgi:hypothetical protein
MHPTLKLHTCAAPPSAAAARGALSARPPGRPVPLLLLLSSSSSVSPRRPAVAARAGGGGQKNVGVYFRYEEVDYGSDDDEDDEEEEEDEDAGERERGARVEEEKSVDRESARSGATRTTRAPSGGAPFDAAPRRIGVRPRVAGGLVVPKLSLRARRVDSPPLPSSLVSRRRSPLTATPPPPNHTSPFLQPPSSRGCPTRARRPSA